MKRKTIVLSLTTKGSLQKAIEKIDEYSNSIDLKVQLFLSKLLEVGIYVGQANCGVYGQNIAFKADIKANDKGFDGILIAMNQGKVIRSWMRGGNVVSAEVNPILMAEFGSGWLANVIQEGSYNANQLNVGQGTFPGGTHAFDRNGWYWKEPGSNELHHSYGEKPTYPMYKASMAIIMQIDAIGKEIFSNS